MPRRDQIILPNVRALDQDPLYRLACCLRWHGPENPPPAMLDLNGGQVAWFLTIKGSAHLERAGRRYLLEPGSILLTDETQRDRLVLPAGASGDWLLMSLRGTASVRYHRHLRTRFGFLHLITPRSAPVREAVAIAGLRPATLADAFDVSWRIYRWLNGLDGHLEQHHLPMRTLLNMSPDQLADSPLLSHTLENFARDLGVSRSIVSQRLARQWGEPPGRVLRRLRLAKARRLLLATRLTVEDIAGKVGFSGARALIFAFKNHYRTTPGALRSSARRRRR